MGKKMKIPSLFKNRDTPPPLTTTRHPWNWASCNHPTTHSFRGDDIFKTLNSVFFDPIAATDAIETPESWFASSSGSGSLSMSTEAADEVSGEEEEEEALELIIHGARSERLFFEPETTSSIVGKRSATLGAKVKKVVVEEEEEPSPCSPLLLEESVVLAVESDDPYGDFRRSMEEMVECHGLRDWESLEELLEWYLRMNGKKNHGFIVGAFVDLLVDSSSSSSSSPSCSDSASFDSAVSSFCSVLSGSSSSPSPSSSSGDEKRICNPLT